MFSLLATGTSAMGAAALEALVSEMTANTQHALECMIEHRLQVDAEEGVEKR